MTITVGFCPQTCRCDERNSGVRVDEAWNTDPGALGGTMACVVAGATSAAGAAMSSSVCLWSDRAGFRLVADHHPSGDP
ncbi:hypothetical protein QMK19_31870 [Streptomyces sp. H10-C2]|uniref:hypothetical protein n=1 Tax=unclassified Streptomyces TaxID=2593676 RepID=UPI0024B9D823|nr:MULTISPECIES: hypothetical protein [unclassified Streptomyces]MDJ0345141.1 hypothetical protein [Streptomyces sp. PH10-H1]MDJ0374109.1 hypothetical protein [Streptomyces sp. H10-C2]